jgi:hypothetical protein
MPPAVKTTTINNFVPLSPSKAELSFSFKRGFRDYEGFRDVGGKVKFLVNLLFFFKNFALLSKSFIPNIFQRLVGNVTAPKIARTP